jgi:signal transduction histidine kinase
MMIDSRPDVVTRPVSFRRHGLTGEPAELLIHDLRNPLSVVNRQAELLRRRVAGQGAQMAGLEEGLRHIQDATALLERLVDRLAGASTTTGIRSTIPHPGPTNLLEVARQTAAQNDRVTVVPGVAELVGCWDPTAVERVLGNLLDNALKYSRSDRPVLVRLEREGAWAVVRVVDQGIGISDADRPKVFMRGFRAPNAAPIAPGTGIGLAAARHLVEALGGTISIDSRVGVGTSVTVRLPFHCRTQPSASLRWCSGS